MIANRRTRIPAQEWARHKATIRRLYWVENKKLQGSGGVMEIMERDHNFIATKAQYEKQLKVWGLHKYAKSTDWQAISRTLNYRDTMGKDSLVYMFGNLVEQGKVQKETQRYQLYQSQTAGPVDMELPEHIRIQTPETRQRSVSIPLRGGPSPFMPTNEGITEAIQIRTFNNENPAPALHYHSYVPQHLHRRPGTPLAAGNRVNPICGYITSEVTFDWIQSLPSLTLTGGGNPLRTLTMPSSIDVSRLNRYIQSPFAPAANNQELSKETIGIRLVPFIIYSLVNEMYPMSSLSGPQNERQRIYKSGVEYLHSLSRRRLSSLLHSVPRTHLQTLLSNLLRTAVELNAHGNVKFLLQRDDTAEQVRQAYVCDMGNAQYTPLERARFLGHLATARVLADFGAMFRKYGDRNKDRAFSHWLDDHNSPLSEDQISIIGLLLSRDTTLIPADVFPTPHINKGMKMVLPEHLSDPRVIRCLLAHVPASNNIFYVSNFVLGCMLATQERQLALRALNTILLRHWPEEVRSTEGFVTTMILALSNAISVHNNDAMRLLLASGAQPQTKCLHIAFEKENMAAIRVLLDLGMDPNEPHHGSEFGRKFEGTPMAEGIRCGSSEIWKLLGETGHLAGAASSPKSLAPALRAACETGNRTAFEFFLNIPDIHEKDELEFPTHSHYGAAVAAAIEHGHEDMAQHLLGLGVQPTQDSLLAALIKGNDDLVQTFLDICPAIGLFNDEVRIDLILAIVRRGDAQVLKMVLATYGIQSFNESHDELAPENDSLDYPIRTPLYSLISRGLLRCAEVLLAAGVSPTGCLVGAAEFGDPDFTNNLLARGVDPFDNEAIAIAASFHNTAVVNSIVAAFKVRYPLGRLGFGRNALATAVELGNLEILHILREVADPIYRDGLHGPSPICLAIASNRDVELKIQMLRALLGNDRQYVDSPDFPNIDEHPEEVFTSLLYAITQGELAIIQELINLGGDISSPAKGLLRRTSLQHACELGQEEIVNFLLEKGADPNQKPAPSGGATALQLAAMKGFIFIADILLKANADINAPPAQFHGRTAFEAATEHGRIDMMIYLVDHGADLLSDDGSQYRRAVRFARRNNKLAACDLAQKLYTQALEIAEMFAAASAGEQQASTSGNVGLDNSGGRNSQPGPGVHNNPDSGAPGGQVVNMQNDLVNSMGLFSDRDSGNELRDTTIANIGFFTDSGSSLLPGNAVQHSETMGDPSWTSDFHANPDQGINWWTEPSFEIDVLGGGTGLSDF